MNIMLSQELLDILVCPLTKQPLFYDRDANELVSKAAGLAFPIRDNIPIMLVEEARTTEASETTESSDETSSSSFPSF